jgi:hypothetical protein
MQSMYATFDSSLPDDWQEIGNRFIQPGFNVASRVQEGLKKRGYPVTDVKDEESYGWFFLVGPTGLFKRTPCVYCLFQSGGAENKWLLITDQMRGSFIFKDDAYYKGILDDINAILVADPVFAKVTWLSEREYNGPKPKGDVVLDFFQFFMALVVIVVTSLPQFCLVLAIVLIGSFTANFVFNAAFGDGYYDNHKWPFFLSLIFSSTVIWGLGVIIAKRRGRRIVVVEQKTGRKTGMKDPAVDWLVWPMKYWSAAILVISLIYLVY